MLSHVDRSTPDAGRLIRAAKGYQSGISSDPALRRAYEVLGGIPSAIRVNLLGQAPDAGLQSSLVSYGDGILHLVAG